MQKRKKKESEPLVYHEMRAQHSGEAPIDIPDGEISAMAGDRVDHPGYYNRGQIEVIDAIEDWQLGFHLGSAVKYIARAGYKDPAKTVQDLKKTVWYLNRHINSLEGRGEGGGDEN